MATQEGLPGEAGLTRFIAERVRRRRKALGMSARYLSDFCLAVGYAIPRSTIADLENGRRQSISVHELLVLARALGISPIDLVYPLEVDGQVDAQGLLDARDWWRGVSPDPSPTEQATYEEVDVAAIVNAVNGLNDLIAKQQDEFNHRLAEQQKVLDALITRPTRTGSDHGARQLKMLEALASLRSTGVEIPEEALTLLEQELPPGILKRKVSCPNSHDVPAGTRFCPECGTPMGA